MFMNFRENIANAECCNWYTAIGYNKVAYAITAHEAKRIG